MSRTMWFIVGCLFVLVSCTKKEEAVESNPPAPSTAITPPVAPAVNPPATDEDDPGLVTSADLEEKAAQAISEKNLDSQLDELEKEIGKSE